MKTKLCILISFIGIAVFCSWNVQTEKQVQKAEWLIGTWENKTAEGSLYETWTKVNNTELYGKSYFLRDKDTMLFETVQLIEKEQRLYYVVSVVDQNNELPVSFASTTITNNKLVFENLEHDFPQVISYTKVNNDSLFAEISGTKNGKQRKQSFPMKRMGF